MPPAPESFIAQASRLVEAARANERAVRDLDETAQLLAAAVDDLAQVSSLADALRDLTGQVEAVQAATREAREVVGAAEALAQTREAAERAVRDMQVVSGRIEAVTERAQELDGRLAELDGRLSQALDAVEQAPLAHTLERIERLEAKVDRVLDLLTYHGEAYAERVEPQVARLEAVAERMDAPAMADELADVLATNHQLFEAIDAMRAEGADAQAYWDGLIEDWHRRHGRL